MDEKATSALPMQNLSESDPNKGRKRKSISPSLNPVEEDAGEAAVKDLLVYYARHSTMHGIPSIVGSRLYRGRRYSETKKVKGRSKKIQLLLLMLSLLLLWWLLLLLHNVMLCYVMLCYVELVCYPTSLITMIIPVVEKKRERKKG